MTIDPDLIDTTFRPESYWDVADPVVAITASIRGEVRRRFVADLVDGKVERCAAVAWRLDGLDLDAEMADALPPLEVAARAERHLWLRGGEHLPDLLPGEVEVARVVVWKTDLLVVSVRARRDAVQTLHWRVVDEVGTRYVGHPRTSARPLTLGDLLMFIDGIRTTQVRGTKGRLRAGTFVELLRLQYLPVVQSDEEIRRSAGLVTVSSPFYPQLEDAYRLAGIAWAEAVVEEIEARYRRPESPDGDDPVLLYLLEQLEGGD